MRRKNKIKEKLPQEKITKFLTRNISLSPKVRFHHMFRSFYGIDLTSISQMSFRCGFSPYFPSVLIPTLDWGKVETHLDKYYYFGRPYEKEKKARLSEFNKIGCYRGIRFSQGLPTHGQRTHSNARTMKNLYGMKKKVNGKKK